MSASHSLTTSQVDFDKTIDLSLVKGKTAVVTGGASGLGLGLSQALAEAGATVIIGDINEQDGENAVKSLRESGHDVVFVHTDVTSWDSQQSLFKAALAHSKNSTLDIVIPCAGVSGRSLPDTAIPKEHPPGAYLPEPSIKAIQINLIGVFYTTNLALHYFHTYPGSASQKKHILLVASIAGYGAQPLAAEYAMSKFGVRGLFKGLRGYTAPFHAAEIRVNLIAPAFVNTPMIGPVVGVLRGAGIGVAEISDFVSGAMRCCCDDSIDGRAIAIGPGDAKGGPGKANFDLCDDPEGFDGAREFWANMQGTLGLNFDSLMAFQKKAHGF